MRKIAWPFAAALTALLLSSCAPSVLGGSANNPFPAAGGVPHVSGGQTIYLRADHSLADFGLEPSALEPALWVPSGYSSELGDVTGQFGFTADRVPDGWGFRLQAVRVERSAQSGSGSSAAGRTVYALWAVYEVTAPTDGIPGPYRFRGALRARGGGEVPVRLSVELDG